MLYVVIKWALLFIQGYILISICEVVSKPKYQTARFLAIIVLCLMWYLLEPIPNGSYQVLFTIIILSIYSIVNLEGNLAQKIVCSTLGIGWVVIINVVMLATLEVGKLSIDILYPIHFIRMQFLTQVSLYFIYVFIKRYSQVPNYLNSKNWIIIIIFSVLSIVSITTLLYMIISNKADHFLLYISIFMNIALTACVTYLYFDLLKSGQYHIENQLLKTRIDKQMQHQKELEAMNEEGRRIKHDLSNHIAVLKGMTKSKEVSDYASELVKQLEASTFPEIKNEALFYLLKSKSYVCAEKNIRFNLQIFEEFDFMEDVDVVALISNLIDNAIDAQESVKENRHIKVQTKGTSSAKMLRIENTISESVLKTNKDLITTKADKNVHGIGLKSVRAVVRKYNGQIKFEEKMGKFYVICIFDCIK